VAEGRSDMDLSKEAALQMAGLCLKDAETREESY
jgi:hypothetical protein